MPNYKKDTIPALQSEDGFVKGMNLYELAKQTAEFQLKDRFVLERGFFDPFQPGGGDGKGGDFPWDDGKGDASDPPKDPTDNGGGVPPEDPSMDDKSREWWEEARSQLLEENKKLLYAAIVVGIFALIKK